MPTPRSYHHGNLKQALLDASLNLIREVGPGAFTLREVARRAGVSHNAPYRHFRDKEELLAALAAEGFDRLTDAMTKAAEPATSALDRFRSSGRGYVEFALRYPQHFAVMFEVPWRYELHPQTQAGGRSRFWNTGSLRSRVSGGEPSAAGRCAAFRPPRVVDGAWRGQTRHQRAASHV